MQHGLSTPTLNASPPRGPGVVGTSLSPSLLSQAPRACPILAAFLLGHSDVAVATSPAWAARCTLQTKGVKQKSRSAPLSYAFVWVPAARDSCPEDTVLRPVRPLRGGVPHRLAPSKHDGHHLRDIFVTWESLKTVGFVSAGKRGHRSGSEGWSTIGALSPHTRTRDMAGGYNIQSERFIRGTHGRSLCWWLCFRQESNEDNTG